jgi:hypothetical protein
MHPDGSPENVRRSVDTCLKLLKGKKKIDIFECARGMAVDPHLIYSSLIPPSLVLTIRSPACSLKLMVQYIESTLTLRFPSGQEHSNRDYIEGT